MPRYRFDWSNHDPQLLQDLTHGLRISGPVPDGLRATYGARPKVDFVKDAWSLLIAKWLAYDRRSASVVAGRLRARGVGGNSEADDIEYIRSLRNTSGSREIVLERFIECGETASVTYSVQRTSAPATDLPGAITAPDDEAVPVIGTTTSGPIEMTGPELSSLHDFVRSVISDMLEGREPFVDPDGDFVLPAGSSVTFVSVLDEPPCVRVFAVVLREVPDATDIWRVINDINVNLRIGRLIKVHDAILLEHYLLPMGLSGEELIIVVDNVRATADLLDDRLQNMFGGKLFFLARTDDEIDV